MDMIIFPLQENINKRAVSIISLEDLVSAYWKLSYSAVTVLPAPLLYISLQRQQILEILIEKELRKGSLSFSGGQRRICWVSSLKLSKDNTSANKKCSGSFLHFRNGETHKNLLDLVKEMWNYLLANGITVTVEYLQEPLDLEADHQSRPILDSIKWKLNPILFKKICKAFWTKDADLFASRVSYQTLAYIVWKPDPYRRINLPLFFLMVGFYQSSNWHCHNNSNNPSIAKSTMVSKGISNKYPQPNFNPQKGQPIFWSKFPKISSCSK